MPTIHITELEIDNIVVYDLKRSLKHQFDLETDEGGEYLWPDYELINALKVVIRYYLPSTEIDKFFQEILKLEADTQLKLGNVYKGT